MYKQTYLSIVRRRQRKTLVGHSLSFKNSAAKGGNSAAKGGYHPVLLWEMHYCHKTQ